MLLRYSVVLSLIVTVTGGCGKSSEDAKSDGLTGRMGELVAALESDDDEKQAEAAAELAAMGPAAAPALDALVDQLQDDNPHVRAHAARALGAIGEAAKAAVVALARAVTDKDAAVRREAIEALAAIKPGDDQVVPLMVEALGNAKGGVLIAAIDALADRGERIVPAMTKALGDEQTVYWALLVLHEVGPDAKSAAPAVAKLLTHDHGEVRHEAALVLQAMGPGAAVAVPELTQSLQSDDADLQVAAAMALGTIGPEAKGSIESLQGLSTSKDDLTRVVVAWAMQKIDPNVDHLKSEVVPLLIGQLKSTDRHVRQTAALALLDLKPSEVVGVDKMVAAFSDAMKDASPEAKQDMLSAIATAGPKAVPALIQALEYPEVRRAVAEILGQIGPEAADAVPALIEAAKDPDSETCSEVLFALARIGPAAKDAVPTAIDCLGKEGQDEEVCVSACYLLGKVGPDASEAVDTLKKTMDGDNERTARVAAWSLIMIDPDNEAVVQKAIPMLVEGLKSDKEFVVGEIAVTLGGLGPKAKEALPALKTAREKATSPKIQETLENAIGKIEGS